MDRAQLASVTVLFLSACQGRDEPQCSPEGPHLVVAATDFESGVLSSVDGADCTADRWSSTGPDPLVRAVGDQLFAIDRAGGDRVRVFDAGRYEVPEHEFSIAQAGNIHDVIAVGSEWWFALYEEDAIVRTSLAGVPVGEIDLSAHADSDGFPEIDRLIALQDTIYASLQRLDRADGWAPLDGMVVGLSPLGEIVSVASLGPNPKLSLDPSDDGALLALTGRWYEPDGALVRYDPRAPVGENVEVLLTEEDLGFDLGGLAGTGSQLVLLGVDFDGSSRLACYDLDTREVVLGRTAETWFVDVIAAEDDVYVAVRTGWNDTIARELWRVDPRTCEDELLTDRFSLDPYTMAWMPLSSGGSESGR